MTGFGLPIGRGSDRLDLEDRGAEDLTQALGLISVVHGGHAEASVVQVGADAPDSPTGQDMEVVVRRSEPSLFARSQYTPSPPPAMATTITGSTP